MASVTWYFPLKVSSNLVSIAWDMESRKEKGVGEGEEAKETEGEGPAHTPTERKAS